MVARQATYTSSSAADGTKLSLRHAAAVTPDASSVAHVVGILESLGRCEVKSSECAGFAEKMAVAH